MLTAVALFVGAVFCSEAGEMSGLLTSVFWFLKVSGCELCGVSGVEAAEVDAAEAETVFSVIVLSDLRVATGLRAVSEAAGWLWGVLGLSVVALSELLLQLAASNAVRLSRQKARKWREDIRFMALV